MGRVVTSAYMWLCPDCDLAFFVRDTSELALGLVLICSPVESLAFQLFASPLFSLSLSPPLPSERRRHPRVHFAGGPGGREHHVQPRAQGAALPEHGRHLRDPGCRRRLARLRCDAVMRCSMQARCCWPCSPTPSRSEAREGSYRCALVLRLG